MNVFRNRKKSVTEADGRPSLDKTAPPVPPLRGRAIFRRKQQPEPKKEIDLTLALPSSEDFRTSLLLPNLSARFSMLREQDDPSSKLGKASDDSVLFPKRSSRLGMFGLSSGVGLEDIAEISSISDRRPFATERHHSDAVVAAATDGYGSEDDTHEPQGSIMNRAKPGQGSNIFGGRQKVLMIPVEGGRSTKAVYHDDVSHSVFKELKRREREARKEAAEAGDYFDDGEGDGDRSSHEQDRQTKRETTSSTNSNREDGRSSTAATSVASQFGTKHSPAGTPGDRPGQKKRLYGQGLDQQLQEQQNSAMSRLNSLQRGFQRTGVAPSRSATSLNQQFRSSSPFSPVLRSGSPSPVVGNGTFGGFDFGANGSNARSASRDTEAARATPPMSPQSASSPVDPTLVAALEPNDIGKATASGAFNKPKGPYNEQQFAQRQLQLQEGRNTPPLRSMSRAESAGEQSVRLRNGSFASARSGQSSRQQFRPGSNTSHTTSEASSHPPLPSGTDTFLAEQSGSEYGSGPNSPTKPVHQPTAEFSPEARPTTGEERRRPDPIDTRGGSRPPIKSFMDPTASTPDTASGTPVKDPASAPAAAMASSPTPPADPVPSPPATAHLGTGLNDLVRGHLRQDSGASSVYPEEPEEAPAESHEAPTSAPAEETTQPSAQESMSIRARQILERANQLANSSAKAQDVLGSAQNDKVQQILGGEAPRRSNDSSRAWTNHNRGASTETQKEREDFASELAERRRQVQDNLMRLEESAPTERSAESSPAKGGPLGLLKKSSRGSLGGGENNAKAMKMLGMSAGEMNNDVPMPHPQQRSHAPSHPRPGEERRGGQGNGPALRERSIGTERRERFLRKGAQHPAAQNFERPGMTGPAPFPPGQYGYGRTQAPAEPNSFYPAGRARKYSPPGTKPPSGPVPLPPGQRMKPSPDRPRPGAPPNGSHFPAQHSSPTRQGPNYQGMSRGSPRGHPPPNPAFSTNMTPPIEQPPPFPPTTNLAVAAQNAQMAGRNRKKSVGKREISEPTLVLGNSSVNNVHLPGGAPHMNGTDEWSGAPPLPAMNPNRRRGGPIPTTQNVFTAFGGPALNESLSPPNSAHTEHGDFPSPREQSAFSDEEHPPRLGKTRPRMRSTTSDGGHIAAKARHHALMREAESMPGSH